MIVRALKTSSAVSMSVIAQLAPIDFCISSGVICLTVRVLPDRLALSGFILMCGQFSISGVFPSAMIAMPVRSPPFTRKSFAAPSKVNVEKLNFAVRSPSPSGLTSTLSTPIIRGFFLMLSCPVSLI